MEFMKYVQVKNKNIGPISEGNTTENKMQ